MTKELKIQFAPGCFDNFEGTQEELDELVAEIQKMFEGKTPEEIQSMGRPIDDLDYDEFPDDVIDQLARSFDGTSDRKLQ